MSDSKSLCGCESEDGLEVEVGGDVSQKAVCVREDLW